MMQTRPPSMRPRRPASAHVGALLIGLMLVVGCAGSDDKDGGRPTPTAMVPATPTSIVPATPTSVVPATPTKVVPATPTIVVGPSPTPTMTGGDLALAACQKLAACNQCFINERGTCVEPAQCAARLSEDEARCINAVSGCGTTALGDCLTVGCGGDGTGDCEGLS